MPNRCLVPHVALGRGALSACRPVEPPVAIAIPRQVPLNQLPSLKAGRLSRGVPVACDNILLGIFPKLFSCR